METYKCAFSHPLMVGEFRCANGQPIVRRGGPGVGCGSESAHRRCARLFDNLKSESLTALGLQDDPLSLPHSILVKIQCGGLTGIARMLERRSGDDVAAMLDAAELQFQGIDAVPVHQLVEEISAYRVKRRRK